MCQYQIRLTEFRLGQLWERHHQTSNVHFVKLCLQLIADISFADH